MKKGVRENVLKRQCPFVQNPPSEDCYCVKLDSLSVEDALYYCGKNFEKCEIYGAILLKPE